MFTGDPTKAQPVVLITLVQGRPTGRDGNNPRGDRANARQRLFEALFDGGIVSMRTDKRGMYASTDSV